MNIQKLLMLYLGVLLVLAGCEGTNPTAPDFNSTTAAQGTPTKPSDDTTDSDIVLRPYKSYVITAIGDSITVGADSSPGTGGYPGMLERKLMAAGYDVTVYNAGINGGSAGVVDREFVRNSQGADIVLIMAGTNDVSAPSTCLVPFNCRTIEHIASMADKALQAGIIPILSTITPKRPGDVYAYHNPAIEALNAEIYRVGAERNVRVVDNYYPILQNGGTTLFSNKHHLNDQGYELVADQFFHVLTTDLLLKSP